MFNFVVILMLVGPFSGILCGPLPEKTTNGSLASLLDSLAHRCQNELIAEQIKANRNECDVAVSPFREKQFVCMMFYDINKQLCDAVVESKLKLSPSSMKKIYEEVDVVTTCEQAKNWPVSELKELPSYKEKVEKVIRIQIGCIKVCGVEDVTSQDTNYFCRYFKWGSEYLRPLSTATPNNKVTEELLSSNATVETNVQAAPDVLPAAHNQSIGVPIVANNGEINAVNANVILPENKKPAVDQPYNPSIKTEIPKPPAAQLSQPKSPNLVPEPDKIPSDIEVGQNSEKSPVVAQIVNPSKDDIDRLSAGDVRPVKKDEEEDVIEESIHKPQKNQENLVPSEKTKPIDQADPDYQDSEEGREGIDGGDDNGDDHLGEEVEPKPEKNQIENKTPKKFETFGEREFYPNTMPEQFAPDDDHFFPFFLTGIILVVLLYVLYHNKSKVSKVFLGLIVEGRQPGRRRNSRGHAYRRLDTLEQAMSANSAAPPSKIIY